VALLVLVMGHPIGLWPLSSAAAGVLLAFAAFAAFALVFAHSGGAPPHVSPLLHAWDVGWTVSVALGTGGMDGPLLLLPAYLLFATAVRFGQRASRLTAVVVALGLAFEAWPQAGLVIARAGGMLALGFLLARVGDEIRERRQERGAIVRILRRAHEQTGFRAMARTVLEGALDFLGGREALVAAVEPQTGRAYLWHLPPAVHGRASFRPSRIPEAARADYFFDAPAAAWCARRPAGAPGPFRVRTLRGGRDAPSCAIPGGFVARHPFRTLLVVPFARTAEYPGRVFVLDPTRRTAVKAQMQFLRAMVEQINPAVQRAFRLRVLHAQGAVAAERARIGREIHDGVLQTLVGVEMQVDALARAAEQRPATAAALREIQRQLRREIVGLREVLERFRPLDLSSERLVGFIADQVEKFGRQTGIAATFVTDRQGVSLSGRACREVARIVQEGLVNVRKHSQASRVSVRFAKDNGNLKLMIDDDGRGFPFSGRLGSEELEAARLGPAIIKERLRTIGGALAIDSHPGRGSRLEITVPENTHA